MFNPYKYILLLKTNKLNTNMLLSVFFKEMMPYALCQKKKRKINNALRQCFILVNGGTALLSVASHKELEFCLHAIFHIIRPNLQSPLSICSREFPHFSKTCRVL